MKSLVLFIISSLLFLNPLYPREGRNLLLDKSLVSETDMQFKYHYPAYYALNPVLKADKAWEFNKNGDPYAAPFSGGVWYDELSGKFKMWYSAGGGKTNGLVTCYAESNDGKVWFKPDLDVVPGTNIVDTVEHDCVSVLLDKFEQRTDRKYKMFLVAFNNSGSVSMKLKYSSDGIHWSSTKAVSGELYDRCAVYYDPFIDKYVLSLKTINGVYRRARCFLADKDPELAVSLAHRTFINGEDKFIRFWFNADDDDPRHPLFPDLRPQIYNHEAMPYENLLLGYFSVWQGPENKECVELKVQKRNEILVGWTKDSFNWNRENKKPFLPVDENPEAWNAGNIQSVAGCPIIVGDSLYFYMSGRYNSRPVHPSNFATGLATLRRDGFASYHSGKKECFLKTVPFEVTGSFLFVNAEIKGSLYAELLDANSNVIKGFSKRDFEVVKKKNSTKLQLRWKNEDISSLIGKKISIRFYTRNTDIYSFWFSKTEKGFSGGYTAGGGPLLSPTGIDQ